MGVFAANRQGGAKKQKAGRCSTWKVNEGKTKKGNASEKTDFWESRRIPHDLANPKQGIEEQNRKHQHSELREVFKEVVMTVTDEWRVFLVGKVQPIGSHVPYLC